MSIIKFLKKNLKHFVNKKQENTLEIITFEDVTTFIAKKDNELDKIKEESSKVIKTALSWFLDEIKPKIEILKSVNLNESKEVARIKHIILTNKMLYVNDVEKLLNDISHFKNLGFDSLTEKINSSFLDFKKRSSDKYKKSTFLIGKEIGDVNECINKFMITYSKIIKEEDKNIELSLITSIIKKKYHEIMELEKEVKEINNLSIHKTNNEIKAVKSKLKEILSNVESVKKSKDYLDNLDNIEKQKTLIIDLNKDLINLKLLIDFKKLSEIYHSSEKYLPIVKNFKDNFNENFKEDKGKTLLHILTESKLNSEQITSKIENINLKSAELVDVKSKIIHDKAQLLLIDVKKAESELSSLTDSKDKDIKRIEKIKKEIDEAKNFLKQEFIKLDVSLKLD